MNRFRLLFLITLRAFVVRGEAPAIAQKQLKFEAITINEGLSQGMVNHILQDRYGFMWFATKEGLNRFDGYQFVVYRHDAAETNSISDNFLQTIIEDKQGRIWIGTVAHGLDLFDRETETFIHFTHAPGMPNRITDNNIRYLGEDRYGAIWVGTDDGLNKITIREKKGKGSPPGFWEKNDVVIQRIILDPRTPDQELYRKKAGHDLPLNSFHIDRHGKIWVSAYDRFFTIEPSAEDRDKITEQDVRKYFTYPYEDKGLERHVQCYVEDTVKKRLYLLSSFCITEVDLVSGATKFISAKRFHYGFLGLQAALDPDGILWMNDSEWLMQINVHTGQVFEVVSKDERMNTVLHAMNVTFIDRSGVVWLASKGYGLLKYNPQSARFHHFDQASVRWMNTVSDSEEVVIRTKEGITIFNHRQQAFTDILPQPQLMQSDLYKYGYVDAVLRDDDGIYWIAKGRLLRYDAKKALIDEYPLPEYACFPIFLDRKKQLWMGTEKAFSSFDRSSKEISHYNFPVEVIHSPYKFLQSIVEDEQGIFWLGTLKGLFRFDPEKISWKQYKNDPANPFTLNFDLVFCLSQDARYPEKFLWIGTNGGGLNCFNKQNGTFHSFTMNDGLPNNVIYGILTDADGKLWMSTNKGISCFTPDYGALENHRSGKKGGFKNYEMKDGLQSNEFNRYAFCKSRDGYLFFGGVNGFNFFNPDELRVNPVIPHVVITDVRLKNQSVSFREKNSILRTPAYLTKEITLPYSSNMITFEFAALEFSAPEKNNYQYRLDGFDREWIQAGITHTATYTNLDPGQYTFRAKGSNNDEVWNETGASVRLVILPPWYMTWWFRLVVMAFAAGLIYSIYRNRLQQALRLQSVRNRIAQDLHDEIGSNLSSISIFSAVAKEKSAQHQDGVSQLLNKISDYAQTSQEAMGDIVWMINPRNDRFENIIARMGALASELFEDSRSQLHFESDETLNSLKLKMDDRKNFYLIFKEAVNNIAKYAECRNVWIEIRNTGPLILLRIRDDGKGFHADQNTHGNGLINMKKRSDALNGRFSVTSGAGQGTSIELQFST